MGFEQVEKNSSQFYARPCYTSAEPITAMVDLKAQEILTQRLEQNGLLPRVLIGEADRLDGNHNGQITRDELEQVLQAPKENSAMTRSAAQYVHDHFAEIDAVDGNSWLSRYNEINKDELRMYADKLRNPAPEVAAAAFDEDTFNGTIRSNTGEKTGKDAQTAAKNPSDMVDSADKETGFGFKNALDWVYRKVDDLAEKRVDGMEGKKPETPVERATRVLQDGQTSAEDKLRAAKELSQNGIDSITLKDKDGNEINARISVSPIGGRSNREYVHVYAADERGREHPILRAIGDKDGNFRQQVDSRGRTVDFVGDWWEKNHPDSNFRAAS